MAKTSISSSTSYVTVAKMLLMHDARKIGDLLLDTGAREASGSLATNEALLYAIKRASGEVEAACLKGGRYVIADLAALSGMSLTVLEGLVAYLALWHCAKRRHKLALKATDLAGVGEAMELLKALASGEAIFSFQEAADAGLPQTETETPAQKDDRGGVATVAERFLGRGTRRRPI